MKMLESLRAKKDCLNPLNPLHCQEVFFLGFLGGMDEFRKKVRSNYGITAPARITKPQPEWQLVAISPGRQLWLPLATRWAQG